MLTHDSGACLITNGGDESNSDGDGDDEDMPNAGIQNQGVIIREIEEGEENGGPDLVPEVASPEDMAPVEDIDPFHNSLENAEDDLQDHQRYRDILGYADYQRYPASIHPRDEIMAQALSDQEKIATERGKRKRDDWIDQSEVNESSKIASRETGESSGSNGSNQCRGAVGPVPPHPP